MVHSNPLADVDVTFVHRYARLPSPSASEARWVRYCEPPHTEVSILMYTGVPGVLQHAGGDGGGDWPDVHSMRHRWLSPAVLHSLVLEPSALAPRYALLCVATPLPVAPSFMHATAAHICPPW